jgi:hypothetical protein
MVVKILAAEAVTVGIRIVSPGKYAGIRDVIRKEIAEPVDAIRSRPSPCPDVRSVRERQQH